MSSAQNNFDAHRAALQDHSWGAIYSSVQLPPRHGYSVFSLRPPCMCTHCTSDSWLQLNCIHACHSLQSFMADSTLLCNLLHTLLACKM